MVRKIQDKITQEALAYDDVLVVPAYSEVLPRDTDTSIQLTPAIRLQIPLLSAAMDTVTDAAMAIAIALEGGLGIVHKNMSIEEQANAISEVKRSQSGVIRDPRYLTESSSVADAKALMTRFGIGGLPVVTSENHKQLIGIVTNRDLRFHEKDSRPITAIMSTPPITIQEAPHLDYQQAEQLLQEKRIEKLPIVDQHGLLKGLITYKDILKRENRPHACKDKDGRLCVGAALGLSDYLERARALIAGGVDILCIDTAHAHSAQVLQAVRVLRKNFEIPLIVGNIATAAAAKALADLGVEAVKVGIGPGSICTTRIIAGIGVPQLSAVINVAEALEGTGVKIIADGGVRFSGDLVKALVGGAHAIMLGSLLAGTEEAPGDVILLQGKKYKSYRGMGSIEAMQLGAKDRYFQEHTTQTSKLVPEGVSGRVHYRGPVEEVLYQLVGGLQAGMGYTGSKTVADLQQARFVRITSSGVRENHPHDVIITREAPNYTPGTN